MIFKVKFSEENTTFKAQFGEIQTVGGTGGYQEGYEYGYKIGKTEGEKIGYQNGIRQGEALGYEKGYAQGENDGYLKGHSVGTTEGYQTGYNKGAEDGQLAGYEKGKTEGHTEGYNEGYLIGEQKGYETGYNSGHSDGYAQGKTDGHTEGYNSGIAEGKLQGYTEGYAEGYDKGLADGEAVGYQKGLKDGEEIGYQKGYIAGETQGYERGYGEGLTAGYENGYNIGFEEGKQSSGADYDEVYNEGYQAGYTDGQESVSNPLEYSLKCNDLYNGAVFPENYELTVYIPNSTAFRYFSAWAKNTKKITIIGKNQNTAMLFAHAFRENQNLIEVDLTNFNVKLGDASMMFYGSTVLTTINGIFDFSESTNVASMFSNCTALEEVRFKQNSLSLSTSFAQSSKLSANSIQSIIDGLATVETAQTITFHGSIVLSDEQKATISSKGWTLAQ